MRDATLTYLFTEDGVWLGKKKRGFLKDLYNGFGGKREEGENVVEAAARELYQEARVQLPKNAFEKAGLITFRFPNKPENDQDVHIYTISEFTGTPRETEEMAPKHFRRDEVPIDEMPPADKHFFPVLLEHGAVSGRFVYSNGFTILDMDLRGER